jgi:glutathione S-transferase
MFIYELPISLYSFKLRLAMALKGAVVETREPPGGTYRSPEFRAINPAGTIPALVDGDFILAETDAIIEYLDETRIGSPLLPSDLKLRARTRMLSRWCDLRYESAVRSLFPQIRSPDRDNDAVVAADTRLLSSLGLFEQTLDEQGPYAVGTRPGLVDCGLAATSLWLAAISPRLKLTAEPGERLTRVMHAVRDFPATSELISTYELSIARWISSS